MLFNNSYKSIVKPAEILFKDRGSKFFAFTFPVKDEGEFKIHLQELKQRFPDATHHCYALVLGPDKSFQKSSDDGEPANTAGKPILRAILSNDLTNIAIIVVRYFGGTMLGVPGLIHAYNKSAQECIQQTVISEIAIEEMYEIRGALSAESDAHRLAKKMDAKLVSSNYDEEFSMRILVTRSQLDKLNQLIKEYYFLKITPC